MAQNEPCACVQRSDHLRAKCIGFLWLLYDGDLYFEGLEPTLPPSPLQGLTFLPRKHKQILVPMVTWKSCLPARVKHVAQKGEKYSAAFYVVPL